MYPSRKARCDMIIKTGGCINSHSSSKFNPFWREVIEHWNELLRKMEEPETVEQIMNQPIWNNPFMKEKYLFNLAWYNAGIKSV